jgi:hypothetical protein
MTPVARARRAQSDDILARLLGLGEDERYIVLRGLTPVQKSELASRRFGFEEAGQQVGLAWPRARGASKGDGA